MSMALTSVLKSKNTNRYTRQTRSSPLSKQDLLTPTSKDDGNGNLLLQPVEALSRRWLCCVGLTKASVVVHKYTTNWVMCNESLAID